MTKLDALHFLRWIIFYVAGLMLFPGAGVCIGDRVFLQNGDRLSGKITQLSEDTLSIKTELAGMVYVKIEDIATLTTDEPMEVCLRDGTIVSRKLDTSIPGRVNLLKDPNEPAEAKTIVLSDIAAICEVSDKPHWKGSISGGMTILTGNTSSETISASIDLQKRSKTDRLTFGGDLARTAQKDDETGDKDTTEDWWKLRGKYDYFLTRRFYVFGNGLYETDRIAELTRRVVLGGGSGYQWVESPAMNFSTEAGVAEVYEEYENDTETSKDVSLQVSYHFDKKINHKFKLIHDFSYFPSMENTSDYYLTSSAELRAGLTKTVYANFKIVFDYDGTPAQDACSTDVKYMLGIGCEF
jgi:putative salt-induced outer membrane protein YdiY